MFRMSHDAVDFFSADFTAAGVIVAGEEYPLGYFAAEALEVSGQLTLDIGAAAKEFAAEAQMFFAARDPSSAGIANEAFRRLWHLLRKLPLYDLLLRVKEFGRCSKVPHMGWNGIRRLKSGLFDGVVEGDMVYFVHSYCVPVGEYTIATCDYQMAFSAAIRKDNFWGCQFHPEKSAGVGEKMIENFLKM